MKLFRNSLFFSYFCNQSINYKTYSDDAVYGDFMEINKICFLKRHTFGVRELYELDLTTNKETKMSENECNIKDIDMSVAQYKAKRLCYLINSWNKQYVNSTILDGIECTFVIVFNDGSMKNVYCKNKMPENFAEFIKISGEE